MKKVPQKYYFGYENEEVEILTEFVDKEYKRKWCVVTNGDRIFTTTKSELRKLEETTHYKRKKQLEKEIEDLKNKKEEIKNKIVKEAVESLAFRMKFNSLFANDGKETMVGCAVAKELKKLLVEKVGDK